MQCNALKYKPHEHIRVCNSSKVVVRRYIILAVQIDTQVGFLYLVVHIYFMALDTEAPPFDCTV